MPGCLLPWLALVGGTEYLRARRWTVPGPGTAAPKGTEPPGTCGFWTEPWAANVAIWTTEHPTTGLGCAFLAARPPARPRAAVEHTRDFIVQRRGRRDAGARFGAHTDRPWPARAPPTGALVTASSCACAILGSLSPAETRSPSAFQWLGRRLINRRTAGRRRCRRPRHVQGVAGPAGEMMMTTSNLGASISHRALRQEATQQTLLPIDNGRRAPVFRNGRLI
ncbi:hypothetical protein ACCO45_005925 [Purpureocillium lilacinum]|uniref:Uncharacterized protein n=1 Tax=Purpureocillium lilacinum TaxID=33203 RepID=A0ACC4DXI6_PURLI